MLEMNTSALYWNAYLLDQVMYQRAKIFFGYLKHWANIWNDLQDVGQHWNHRYQFHQPYLNVKLTLRWRWDLKWNRRHKINHKYCYAKVCFLMLNHRQNNVLHIIYVLPTYRTLNHANFNVVIRTRAVPAGYHSKVRFSMHAQSRNIFQRSRNRT